MTIEETLLELKGQDIAAVVMVKANVDYSVVPLTKNEYVDFVLLKEHYNDKTIKKALIKLLNKEI